MGYLTGQFVGQTKKSCQVYLSQQCVSARWAGCPFTRSEGDLCAELSGHMAKMPFLLIGNRALEDDDVS